MKTLVDHTDAQRGQRIERRENELKEMSEKTGVPVNEMGTRLSTIKQLEEHDKATRIERRKSHVLLRATKTKRELDYMCEVEGGMSVPRATLRYYLRRLGLLRPLPHDHTNRDLRLEPTLTQASVSSNDSFKSFRQQLRAEQRKELRMKLGFSFMLFLMFWFVGAAVFSTTENWTYFEGMWFCFVFFSTIGYGRERYFLPLTTPDNWRRRLHAQVERGQVFLPFLGPVWYRNDDRPALGSDRVLDDALPRHDSRIESTQDHQACRGKTWVCWQHHESKVDHGDTERRSRRRHGASSATARVRARRPARQNGARL